MRLKLNRYGEATGSGLMYLVFFLMVVVIVGGIYGGIVAFFGKGYDYRQPESESLLGIVRDCVSKNKFDLSSLKNDDFFSKCVLNSNVIEDGNHMIYIRDSKNKEFIVGVKDFKTRCDFISRSNNLDFPSCSSIKVEDYDIIVGSSQNSKRILV